MAAKMGVMIISLLMMVVGISAQGNEVLDTDNKPVIAGGSYYIIDKASKDEQGKDIMVTYASRMLSTPCPRVAVVPKHYISPLPHVPVNFDPKSRAPLVSENEELSINFVVKSWPCDDNAVWTVDDSSTGTHHSEINFGGKPNTRLTSFKMEKYGDGYIFTHSDKKTGERSVIGVRDARQLGFKRLVLLDVTEPFVVVFKNAEKSFKRSSMLSMVPFYNSLK